MEEEKKGKIAISTTTSGTTTSSTPWPSNEVSQTLPPEASEIKNNEVWITLFDDAFKELPKQIQLSDIDELMRKMESRYIERPEFLKKKFSLDIILEFYRRLNFTSPGDADLFFTVFGPGKYIDLIERPFERFIFYEKLLIKIQKDDPKKYESMHKGTPFFFMAWTAFEMGNYEKGLFYLDAAISEDKRASPKQEGWLKLPGGELLTLRLSNHPGFGLRKKIETALKEQLNRFNRISGLPLIDIGLFIKKFVTPFYIDSLKTTLITSLYSFILEFDDRYSELKIRSSVGGSVEPFITHLFKGGLILETLLKHLYPKIAIPHRKKMGEDVEVLGDIFYETDFKIQFCVVESKAASLREIYDGITANDIKTAFDTTARLRNTTGHNLIWQDVEDVLGNPEKYRKLFEQEVNALLFIIERKFLR
ncbi:MAG: hypothetical protein ABH969_00680 [Pseudomonadota bacterium]